MDYIAIRTLRKRCPIWQRILFLLRNLNAGRERPVLVGAHNVQYWHGENLGAAEWLGIFRPVDEFKDTNVG